MTSRWHPLTDQTKRDLLEILDDRYDKSATIITSQLPLKQWHAYLDDPTLADAILDRLVHNAYTRVFLKTGVTDGRLGIDALRALASQSLKQDVLSGCVFAFCNRRRNRVRRANADCPPSTFAMWDCAISEVRDASR